MKQIISIAVILVIVASVLCGCGNTTSNTDTTNNVDTTSVSAVDTSVSDTIEAPKEEEVDISIFPEVKTTSENISLYREEVSRRLSSLKEDDSFISDKEWEAISNSQWLTDSKYRHNAYFTTFDKTWESVTKYYYPVVFREGNFLVLWYTTENGALHFEKLYGYGNLGGNYGGTVHYNVSSEALVSAETDYAVTYTQETGEVKVWKFGTCVDTFTGIPTGSIYCGFSIFEGYIFRSGSDVYSLKAIDTHNGNGSVECIAHNVQYVIDADYYYGSDDWSQPLFQMTDGSIKCYIGRLNKDAAPDATSNLYDLRFEGSWDK